MLAETHYPAALHSFSFHFPPSVSQVQNNPYVTEVYFPSLMEFLPPAFQKAPLILSECIESGKRNYEKEMTTSVELMMNE